MPKKQKATTKDESTKTKNKKKINAKHKDEKQKNRAKWINKASRRAARKKPIFSEYFSPRLPSRQRKDSREHTKNGKKRRFTIIRAYRGGHGVQYKRETSVLCLYCLFSAIIDRLPLCHAKPLRCLFSIFVKIFFLFFYFHFLFQSYT